MLLRRLLLLAVITSTALAVELPREREKWTRSQIDGFTIYSNAREGVTRQVSRNLQSLRWAISAATRMNVAPGVPTRVFVFADGRSFNPFRDAMFAGPSPPIAGLFQRAPTANFILINAEAGTGEIVYHELLHLFAANTASYEVPVWFNEGLAELYSSFQSSGKRFYIGRAIPHHIHLLRDQPMIPLARLLRVQHGDPEYTEQYRQTIFYAQSWALVHYLLIGEPKHRDKVTQLLQLLAENKTPEEAFNTALGVDLKTVESELRKYVRKTLFASMQFSVDEVPEFETERPVPVPREELLVGLAELLLHSRADRSADIRKFADAALAINSSYARAHTLLGMMAQRQGNDAEARKNFERAVALNPEDELPYVALGDYLLAEMTEGSTGKLSSKQLEPVRALYRRAIELNAQSARAWAAMGRTYLLTDEKPNAGITALERSWQIAPSQEDVAYNLAVLYTRFGDRKRAEAIIERVLKVRQSEELLRGTREAMAWVDVEEGYRLINSGDVAAGILRLKAAAASISDAAARSHIEEEIARAEKHERMNTHIRMYNDAVSLANKGQYARAYDVLEELLAANPDPTIADEARALRKTVKSRLPKKKK